MEFKDLVFQGTFETMERAKAEFANGFGVSVIRGKYSYGGEKGLYELAVTKDGELCYDTEITNDVIGYLTREEVTEYIHRIEALEPTES